MHEQSGRSYVGALQLQQRGEPLEEAAAREEGQVPQHFLHRLAGAVGPVPHVSGGHGLRGLGERNVRGRESKRRNDVAAGLAAAFGGRVLQAGDCGEGGHAEELAGRVEHQHGRMRNAEGNRPKGEPRPKTVRLEDGEHGGR
jgi:hypothetical protein